MIYRNYCNDNYSNYINSNNRNYDNNYMYPLERTVESGYNSSLTEVPTMNHNHEVYHDQL